MSLHTKEGSHVWGPLQDTFLEDDFWGQRASTYFKALDVLWANCFPGSLCFGWVEQNMLSDCTSFWTIVLASLFLWQGRWCALAISICILLKTNEVGRLCHKLICHLNFLFRGLFCPLLWSILGLNVFLIDLDEFPIY